MNAKNEHSSLEQIQIKASHLLARLLAKNCQPNTMQNCLDDIRCLLDCLPLDTWEHGLACLRIKNAHRFVASNEYGAAKFEIKMLKGALKNFLTGQTVAFPKPQIVGVPNHVHNKDNRTKVQSILTRRR